MIRPPPRSTPFPYTTPFRSRACRTTLLQLISGLAMIDKSNIPRFEHRLEIGYDHRPALRHSSNELGVRPFHRMRECELRGRARGLNLVDAAGVAFCPELGPPFT